MITAIKIQKQNRCKSRFNKKSVRTTVKIQIMFCRYKNSKRNIYYNSKNNFGRILHNYIYILLSTPRIEPVYLASKRYTVSIWRHKLAVEYFRAQPVSYFFILNDLAISVLSSKNRLFEVVMLFLF